MRAGGEGRTAAYRTAYACAGAPCNELGGVALAV